MSPSPSSTNSKTGSDDNTNSRMSEAALRKKKNADAQAAFRARRANYIATLEETVTNLEAVVIQLQDSCREAKREASELRMENQRLKQEARRQDRLLKRCLPGKGAEMSNDHDDFPPAPPYSVHPPSVSMPGTPMNTAQMGHYSDDTVNYNGTDYQTPMASTSYSGHEYPQRSPAMGFARSVDGDASIDSRSQQMEAQRRYDQYHYTMDTTNCDGTWTPQDAIDSGSSSHSPTFVESPILTSPELAYPARFAIVEDQKVPLQSLNTSYMFSASRSISPASTPTSTSSVSLSSAPFQFTFPEGNIVQDRPDFGYRRHTGGPELTLHGGTANIPIAAPGGDALRYRLGGRSNTVPDRPVASAISPYSRAENGSGGRESDDSEAASYTYSSRSRPRSAASSTRVSRSPSPPPICGTLAVIKAQAFGALRRTRTRSKKSTEGAAKAAVEALEARGIGMGIAVGTKRARMRIDDDGDMQL